MTDPVHRNPWTRREGRVVYDNPWMTVIEDAVLTPAGTPGIYGVVRPKGLAIGVVPVDDAGHTWLVGQWRYPLDRYSWEIPEGGGRKSEPPIDEARRELAEETGLAAEHWQELIRLDLSNSLSDEQAIIFLCWGLTEGEAAPEETEDLMVRRVPLSEAFRMVAAGEITDAMAVAALQRLELLSLRGHLPAGVRIA
ncbi:NUDIX domain-containing protein [Caenispirillum bisanense]|uniref:GDP-mannose pyrophosphatase n=1 Tax=Caenispirillum bisanense TaxID=414052 RepID=A0A286H142_9PROT|nr:NUDIX hydrolase [Caenispirillum bisanense]SOE01069.1 8-oxo-dGTP pyrophosphatase MutT, NUDIX family [Caenispirillum bisanense]